MKSARTFTASLKPAWDNKRIKDLLISLKGTAIVHAINHDSDTDDDGNPIENHTHILIDYETPRKVSTVANLLGVESNFIEIVRSKKASLRYLVHLDHPEKHRYDESEVIHNHTVPYSDMILGQNLSDKEIANYIREGRGLELMGIVSATKLRTIQAFLQYDQAGRQYQELTTLRREFQKMSEAVGNINDIVTDFQSGFIKGAKGLNDALMNIGKELRRVATIATKK